MKKTTRSIYDVAAVAYMGTLIGRNQAFGMVSGRCSAAQAAGLKSMRDHKAYECVTKSWGGFCKNYLRLSASHANYIIRLLEEFGVDYFELAQLTRVSVATYRAIEPNITGGALNFNGEHIELNPENAAKLAGAVAELRKNTPAREPRRIEMPERLDALDKQWLGLLNEFNEIYRVDVSPTTRQRLMATFTNIREVLDRIESEC